MSEAASELIEKPAEARVQRLRSATHALHETLDGRISAANPFADRERYGLFLTMQRLFHEEVDPLYLDADLNRLVPGLASRRRLDLIDRDLADLGLPIPEARAIPDPEDRAAALGWLYVAEGSNLGAAFLLKAAEKLGLDETFGARHLAAHPEGRGLHWRRFVTSVDAAELTPEEDRRAEAGAVAAFQRVQAIADEVFG
jgi:heme oxygenase